MTAVPRVLAVAPKSPLPADSGGRQRLVELVGALTELGSVDLVVTTPLDHDARRAVAELGVARIVAPSRPAPYRSGWRLRALVVRDRPRGVVALDPAPVIAEVAAELQGPYDLAWFSEAATLARYAPLAGSAPTVLDLADIVAVQMPRLHDLDTSGLRWRSMRARSEIPRARRFERAIAASAGLTTVCSTVDAAALGVDGAIVVPNGAAGPDLVPDHGDVGEPPTLLFVGQLAYPPNEDAARWAATDILPRVRRAVPGTRLRIVGPPVASLAALESLPGVTLVGRVPDVDPELAQADIALAPLRAGSGTRIKILEAFAHGVPVVATPLGAEGLAVADGIELRLADDAAGLAAACVALLTDTSARRAQVAAARGCWQASYQWPAIRRRFVDEVGRLVARQVRR